MSEPATQLSRETVGRGRTRDRVRQPIVPLAAAGIFVQPRQKIDGIFVGTWRKSMACGDLDKSIANKVELSLHLETHGSFHGIVHPETHAVLHAVPHVENHAGETVQ